ncbi:methyl-accepting chemotaxis protein [Rhodovulum strictum]|uniref:HAMP domain-containing protein n=1 Tax=Rhodovulum strictum TaxID=58314 RepID=A0A844B2R0_9RHOB|nr:methyl-accepting chemotaxis protein [Rhodovulum strictum]MRH20050.1 HAMP domain-containing protein [Rhodovulum strictum]
MATALHRTSTRIYAIIALALLLTLVLAGFLMSRAVDIAYSMRELELEALSDVAISQLADLERQVDEGTLSLEAAQELGRQTLATYRFGQDGYFFAFDNALVFQVHPFRPDWIGTDMSGFQDVKGMMLFQEMRRVARDSGSGRVDYWFNKPGTEIPEMKMGYVKAFAPWGWMIGTGAYVSDIRADLAAKRNTAFLALGLGMLFLVGTSLLLVRSITVPLSSTLGSMDDVAEGHYKSEITVATRLDEFGTLGRRLSAFRDKLVEAAAAEADRERARSDQTYAVERLGRGLTALAAGDLTHRLDAAFAPDYEQLRHDFNATVATLNEMLGSIVENATEIHARAEEIGTASDDLSQRTENQAATLEETAAALDELTSSVRAAADGAAEVERVVSAARGDAEASGRVVTDAIGAMSEIKRSSDEIGQIIGVIDDIAFQTNLLALNAGVEAARAGEAGRGFAVVASEVRALAQRSSDAAKEIKTLIGTSSDQVESGVALVNRAGEALSDIVGRVANIADLVSGIATGAQEQSVGLGEINVGVTQLDQVTQQNAAMVEEATAASATLRHEAETLQGLVARFRLQGGQPGPSTALPPLRLATPTRPAPPSQPKAAAELSFPAQRKAANDTTTWQDF